MLFHVFLWHEGSGAQLVGDLEFSTGATRAPLGAGAKSPACVRFPESGSMRHHPPKAPHPGAALLAARRLVNNTKQYKTKSNGK